jgi:Na+/H+ antiporter NhaD/arsenite permease-like protein
VLSDIVASVPVDQRQIVALILIVWASAIFSAFVDNIPFTATMVPVLQQLVSEVEGVSIRPLAWALCLGACFGGNGTLIGASANIVMASKAEVVPLIPHGTKHQAPCTCWQCLPQQFHRR